MNEQFYYNGTQIKNYLVGFASLFSEIPYADRYGKIKTVPIHYGSPSDVMSFLESNVDNEETTNRNRLKDISIPLFSFRLIGIEHNIEKRRAPLDSKTVDLRPMGYNTGYVTMMPAPYKFTMELVCWASSDYQAFEISEQIIPYFNSPQQVTIEPLPRSPVSKTEVFLDSIEIDTDPESQKYSATITMNFSLTGWMFAQPRIWSTNLKFELSVLDSNSGINTMGSSKEYSFDKSIVDLNSVSTKIKSEKTLSLDEFVYMNTKLNELYAKDLFLYNALMQMNKIDAHGNIINNTDTSITYHNELININSIYLTNIINRIDDVKLVYNNSLLLDIMKSHNIESSLVGFKKIFDELDKDILTVYLKLLENGLATKDFNTTNLNISNTEKLNIFGSLRYDFNEILVKLQRYLAILENIILDKNSYKSDNVIPCSLRELPKYIIAIFAEKDTTLQNEYFDLIQSHFGMDKKSITENNNIVKKFIDSIKVNPTTQTINGSENSISQAPVYDINGNLLYDSNNDGYINETDIKDLNLEFVSPISNMEIINDIWYKNNIQSNTRFDYYIKTLIYFHEKNNYAELIDYLKLDKAGYIVSSADMYPLEHYEKRDILESLGYNIIELEDSLLFIRLLVDTLEMIFINFKSLLISKLHNLNNIDYIKKTELDINKLALGLYVAWYIKSLERDIDKELKISDLKRFIDIDNYLSYTTGYMSIFIELHTTGFLSTTLISETKWFESKVSGIETRVNNKYKNK